MKQVKDKIYKGMRQTQVGVNDTPPYMFEHVKINENIPLIPRTKIQNSVCENPRLFSLIQNVHARVEKRFKTEEYDTSNT